MMVEKWKTAELRFVSDYPYADPLFDVSLSVTFKSERGTIIERPAFWNGAACLPPFHPHPQAPV